MHSFAPSPGEAYELNPYRRRARDPELLEFEEYEEEVEGIPGAMLSLAAYELNPRSVAAELDAVQNALWRKGASLQRARRRLLGLADRVEARGYSGIADEIRAASQASTKPQLLRRVKDIALTVTTMMGSEAYELNPQTYWGAGGGHYHGRRWHPGGGRYLDPRYLPRPPYSYHPGGGHRSHGFHPGSGYNANPHEAWDDFEDNPGPMAPAYGYGHLPYFSPPGPALAAAAANPRACARCGVVDCPCGCAGDPLYCVCPVGRNPQTYWGAGGGYYDGRNRWRPGGGRYLDPGYLPRPPYSYHPGGGHRSGGYRPGAGYFANPRCPACGR
jgi:hypothetical protein